MFNAQGSVHRKYIPIYFQQDATLHILFISWNRSTCFGWYLHPSSGAHTVVSTASGSYQSVTATCPYRGRVGTQFQFFHDVNKLCKVPSCWIYIGIEKVRLPGEHCTYFFVYFTRYPTFFEAVLRRMRSKLDNPLPNQIFSPTFTNHAVCTKALWARRLHLNTKYFGFFGPWFAERYKKTTCIYGIQILLLMTTVKL